MLSLDLSPEQALAIYGDEMPSRIARSYRRYRVGSSAFKVDYAIDGDIPWTNPDCARAGTLHLGGSAAEIAAAEFLSEATVKTHVSRILTKLQLRDRVQLVVYAYEHDLV